MRWLTAVAPSRHGRAVEVPRDPRSTLAHLSLTLRCDFQFADRPLKAEQTKDWNL
jgi:hypothetical protein